MQSRSFLQLDNEKLKKVFLFSDLNEEELDSLKSICSMRAFGKNEIIFFDTEPYRGFYCVSKGKVRIYKVAKDGREHTLHFVSENFSFAEVPMFENPDEDISEELVYPANAVALEDPTQLIFIPKKEFFRKFAANPKIYLKMISSLSKRLRLMNQHIESITLHDASKRLANFLIKEVDQKNPQTGRSKPVQIGVSRSDLASYLGIAPETLSRILGKFQEDGLITISGRSLMINDFASLSVIANQ